MQQQNEQNESNLSRGEQLLATHVADPLSFSVMTGHTEAVRESSV